MKRLQKTQVTVIVPLWNASTTIIKTLESVITQTFPIKEIIVIDNHSSDDSIAKVEEFKRLNKEIKLKLIVRDKTYGISDSYNYGAKLCRTEFFVTIHSDSQLRNSKMLEKLVAPILKNPSIVATYPLVVHPMSVWRKYNFWQKCQFAPVAGSKRASLNGKFDCYRKSAFIKIKGYDNKRFDKNVGSEDADFHFRLKKLGDVASTRAEVIHLHNLNRNYSLKDWVGSRRYLSRSYGAHIRIHFSEIGTGLLLFFLRPLLAVLLLFGIFNPFFILPFILLPFLYMRKMFLETSTLKNIRILVLPLVVYWLIFAESYWMLKGLWGNRK